MGMTDPQAGRSWRRSSACHPEECIEVALSEHDVLTRDSKAPGGPILVFSPAAWREFQKTLHGGVDDGETP